MAIALTVGALIVAAGPAGAGGRKSNQSLMAVPQTPLVGLQPGDEVSFTVTEPARASLWVSNRCYQDGAVVSSGSIAVVDNVAGPFSLTWDGGGAAECWTYTWAFPNASQPLRDTEFWYSVG
jgi:hypothetical protein